MLRFGREYHLTTHIGPEIRLRDRRAGYCGRHLTANSVPKLVTVIGCWWLWSNVRATKTAASNAMDRIRSRLRMEVGTNSGRHARSLE